MDKYEGPESAKRPTMRFGERLLITGAIALAIYLLVPVILLTVFSAFRVPSERLPFEPGTFWGLDNIVEIYTTGTLVSTLADTTIFVAGSVSIAVSIGFTLAWLVERTDLPLRSIVFLLVLFPLTMPSLVITMGWLLLLTERVGVLNVAIRTIIPLWTVGPFDVFSFYGMILVQGIGLVPLIFIFLIGAFRNIDPGLEEASRSSGASTPTTLWRITAAVMRPSVLGVALIASILVIESFEVPLLLAASAGADIFGMRLYFALNDAAGGAPAYGTVGALGLHFLLLTCGLFVLYWRFTRRTERYVTLTGRRYRAQGITLGQWRWPLLSLIALFLLVTSLAPFCVLVWTSLFPQYIQPSVSALSGASLTQYAAVLTDGRVFSAWMNTMVVALVAPTISVSVGLVIAWAVSRRKPASKLTGTIDLLLSSSIAIPGVIAANAFLLFYLRMNHLVPLYGTVTILVLVYAYRLAIVYRMNRAGFAQIAAEMEDASAASGATGLQTFRHILVPMMAPALFVAWLFLFLVAFREFTLPLVIGRESPPFVVSVLIWKLWGQNAGQAAALSVLTVVFLTGTIVTLRIFAARRFKGAW